MLRLQPPAPQRGGDPVNAWTALKLSRAVTDAPIVAELDAWLLPVPSGSHTTAHHRVENKGTDE